MSSQTSPINNRLRISRGWNNSYFPQNKNEYSRNVSLWLKLYLLIKVYLELKNFKLVSCELKFTNNNRKILFLNLFKCLKEKKKKKNKSKIQHSFKFPLQRLNNKKAIFLIYKNLKNLKKITNLKYSSVLFYRSKHLWLKKSPLLKKQLINKFRRSVVKFTKQYNTLNNNDIILNNNKNIFSFLPHIIVKQKKQLQSLEKNYLILSQFYTQLFFNNKKKATQYNSSSWLLAKFVSDKLNDVKTKINKTKIKIERLFKRKEFYKKKKTLYFIQKIRLRLKKKLKNFIYLTRFQKINNFMYSKLLVKKNKKWNYLKPAKNFVSNVIKGKKLRVKKNKKQHIRLILKNKKKQILLFNVYFNFIKNKCVSNYINTKNIRVLKQLMASYIGYYSINVSKKQKFNNTYNLIYKKLINSELSNLFNIHNIKTLKYKVNSKKQESNKKIKNKLNKYFIKYQKNQLKKLIRLSFKSIKRKFIIKKIKQKKIKKVWGVFKRWNKKNKIIKKLTVKNRKLRKILVKKKPKGFKSKQWKNNKKKIIKQISKQARQKYFSYKNFLVQFQLQNLIKEYIFKYFKLSCIVQVVDVISKFKNSKLFYLALTKNYGPKKQFLTKKPPVYSFLGSNNWRFIPTNNRLKKNILRKKKRKIVNWELKIKKIKKTKFYTKFKILKNKKQINEQKWELMKEKKTMFRNVRNKSLLARLLPILSLFSKDLDPKLLAQQIAKELEGTKNHWPIIYTVRNILRTYQIKQLRGYRIGIYGKINSSDRTRLFYINSGRIPIQTFSEPINYASAQSRARAGTFGIKIWIF